MSKTTGSLLGTQPSPVLLTYTSNARSVGLTMEFLVVSQQSSLELGLESSLGHTSGGAETEASRSMGTRSQQGTKIDTARLSQPLPQLSETIVALLTLGSNTIFSQNLKNFVRIPSFGSCWPCAARK